VEALSQFSLADAAGVCEWPAGRGPKVLFLIDGLLGMGGAEGALLRMVTHLPKLGCHCSIGAFDLSRDPEFLKLFPCPVYDLTLRRIYDWNAPRVAVRLWRLIGRERFDIVHTMFPASDLWGASIARLAGRPLLVSSRRDMGIVRSRKHDLAYRWLGGHFDQVQAVSEAVRRACIAHDRLQPERVVTVHNGVEFDRILAAPPFTDLAGSFGLNPDAATVVTALGKIWPVKGVDVLIRAAAIVCRELPRTNFLVAGWMGGDNPRELRELARSLGVAANVKFVGRLRPILSVLKSCDIFCLLSRSEGLSNALLEAMACGLPCVATAVGGNPEVVVPGQTGFLVESENADAAAARILALLRDPALRRRLGDNGRERVRQRFTVEAMVPRVAGLYRELLRHSSRAVLP
jgi:glycosyltransferase involved in cell wall biosynthesis